MLHLAFSYAIYNWNPIADRSKNQNDLANGAPGFEQFVGAAPFGQRHACGDADLQLPLRHRIEQPGGTGPMFGRTAQPAPQIAAYQGQRTVHQDTRVDQRRIGATIRATDGGYLIEVE